MENFFKICGIYVKEKKISENDKIIRDGIVLFILGQDCRDLILDCQNTGTVYLVPDSDTFHDIPDRRDIVAFNTDEIKEEYRKPKAFQILNSLFCEWEEKIHLCKLMQIFITQQLWGTVWLFKEIAKKKSSAFDRKIEHICEETMFILQKDQYYGKSPYFSFMYLYCFYIKIGVSNQNQLEKYGTCQKLLNMCSELSKTERGWDIPLCLLAGSICALSIVYEKQALNFYKRVNEIEKSPQILYEIGNIYEEVYGNNRKASLHYKEAYIMDKTCLQALYKVAYENEKNHNWMQALNQYQSISQYREDSMVHIEDILCLHKANIRIAAIRKKYFADDIIHINHTQNIDGNIYWKQSKLSTLLRDMSIENVNAVKREFLEELKL